MIPEDFKPQYTFFMDFGIAEPFGVSAIKDTYKRAFSGWKENVTAMEELTLCLNHKCWHFYSKGNKRLMELYGELYEKCYAACCKKFKGGDLHEYLEFLD